MTELSSPHLHFASNLRRWNIEALHEYVFEPYRVDVYVPSMHAAIEVDGPSHGSSFHRRDLRRDRLLQDKYKLRMLHLRLHELNDKQRVLDFLISCKSDALARYRKAENLNQPVAKLIDWGPS